MKNTDTDAAPKYGVQLLTSLQRYAKLISKCKTIRKWKKNHLSEIKILY